MRRAGERGRDRHLASRIPNPHNLVKATITALSELRDPMMVARARGVSMDKVFNG